MYLSSFNAITIKNIINWSKNRPHVVKLCLNVIEIPGGQVKLCWQIITQ